MILVTLLLQTFLLVAQTGSYDSAPTADISEVQGFETFATSTGELNNYGEWFRTTLITQLFSGNDYVNFKVYWQASETSELKQIAHGSVRTVFRFSTTLKEPGFYYCKFTHKDGTQKMIGIDAQTTTLNIALAEKI